MHGVLTDFDAVTGHHIVTHAIIKKGDNFEIWDKNTKSVCGRHPTMKAAFDAYVAHATAISEKGLNP
jgi:hypothetical protein